MVPNFSVPEAAQNIRLLVLDVDGVLTDGSIIYSDSGEELKKFHVRDGSALKLWRAAGNRAAIISGRTSGAVSRRAEELGITPVLQGRNDKSAALDEVLKATGYAALEACVIGDDLADLPIMRRCQLAIAVADACPEVREAAHHVTMKAGGCGAVREAVEWLLKLQGVWAELIAQDRPAG